MEEPLEAIDHPPLFYKDKQLPQRRDTQYPLQAQALQDKDYPRGLFYQNYKIQTNN